jgi:medium-chain acyl-[acyl-carrier-protein] hydrolase
VSRGNPWLPFGTYPDAECRLVCFPHAGAGASTFSVWGEGLPSSVRACPVQPPGRERRRRESPFTHVGPLADEIAREISASVDEPFALFGHSTGALCAFETARALRRVGGPQPIHLFVSGRPAPQIPIERHDLSVMTVAELTDILRELGGTPEELLANPDMMGFLQPLLAADFAVNEQYDYVPEAPLDIPVTTFVGVEDAGAGIADAAPWEEQTSSEFNVHQLAGGHFAVFDHAAEVHQRIAAVLLGSEHGRHA